MSTLPLQQLHCAALSLWSEYQRRGPGQLPKELLDAVEVAGQRVTEERGELSDSALASIHQILELSRRCVLRAEGLSFVTGEAGLVPRRDLYQAFEAALGELSKLTRAQGTKRIP